MIYEIVLAKDIVERFASSLDLKSGAAERPRTINAIPTLSGVRPNIHIHKAAETTSIPDNFQKHHHCPNWE